MKTHQQENAIRIKRRITNNSRCITFPFILTFILKNCYYSEYAILNPNLLLHKLSPTLLSNPILDKLLPNIMLQVSMMYLTISSMNYGV